MEGLRDAGFYGVDVLKEQIRELDELEDTKKDSVKAVSCGQNVVKNQ